MKGIDIFCASASSIAICRSIDVSSVTRHGRLEGNSSMRKSLIPGLPSKPKGFHHLHHQQQQKSKHSSSSYASVSVGSASSSSSSSPPASSAREIHGHKPKTPTESTSSAFGSSRLLLSKVAAFNRNKHSPSPPSKEIRRRKSKKISESKSPSSSSRYLLSDTSILSILPDIEPLPALIPITPTETDQSPIKDSPATPPSDQVVVLKVSIHCKGCEMKVRKHISRMEGVSSFTIDAKTKKVTIVGDVSPMGVLQSVSRVKYAQFWSSAAANS
ncbi:Copper transport protein [Nymphaea thermarum]|nr:Copper transport protein [Nymphaea thermarum]